MAQTDIGKLSIWIVLSILRGINTGGFFLGSKVW